jgi:hypothetical protein
MLGAALEAGGAVYIGAHVLAFDDFPAEHWIHVRRTNPIAAWQPT